MEPVCYIVGAMEPGELRFAPRRPRLVIAADRGLYYLERQGIRADLIVGDFDSLGRTPEGENVLRHPVEKDDTDMLLAVKEGLARGLRTFVLYGGLGGRLDHAYANLQTLTFLAERGAAGYLLGEGLAASAIRGGAMDFPADLAGDVSVFCPDGRAEGVALRGLYYPLEDAALTSGFPLGVSNRFTGRPARVSVERGTLLVIWREMAAHLMERL